MAMLAPGKETTGMSSQYLLWIDGVGGFLVCLGNRLTIGQARPEGRVDIPIYADVSSHHATLIRDSEGYMLEAMRKVQVNGKEVTRALLRPQDRITLGSSCQMIFRQPVAASASAKLDVVSGHRLRLSVDGILLMADTLVLGPGSQSHVVMPDLKQPVVLYRNKNQLGVSYAGSLNIGGQAMKDRGIIAPGATVQGEDFSLAVENA